MRRLPIPKNKQLKRETAASLERLSKLKDEELWRETRSALENAGLLQKIAVGAGFGDYLKFHPALSSTFSEIALDECDLLLKSHSLEYCSLVLKLNQLREPEIVKRLAHLEGANLFKAVQVAAEKVHEWADIGWTPGFVLEISRLLERTLNELGYHSRAAQVRQLVERHGLEQAGGNSPVILLEGKIRELYSRRDYQSALKLLESRWAELGGDTSISHVIILREMSRVLKQLGHREEALKRCRDVSDLATLLPYSEELELRYGGSARLSSWLAIRVKANFSLIALSHLE